MGGDRRIFWAVLVVAVLVVAALVAWPRFERRVAPRPTAAWVAIEVEGAGVARVGPVSIDAETPFTLHAVLEARTRDGGTIYYTEAPGLAFGERQVAAESIRRWPAERPTRVLWFTVEGPSPFLELSSAADLERFGLVEFLRSDWPFTWSLRGRLEPAHDDQLARAGGDGEVPFGTQRFQVRIELLADRTSVLPEERFVSWGGDALPARAAEFPTVSAALPGVPRPAAEVFGLTQIGFARDDAGAEPPPAPAVRDELVELTRQRLAFARVPLLAQLLSAAGVAAGEVAWQPVELAGTLAWEREIRAGDLLRAGDRVVVLYRDAAPADPVAGVGAATVAATDSGPGNGRLDADDLCLDYARGAAVRRLSEVFDLTAEGTVAWAPLDR